MLLVTIHLSGLSLRTNQKDVPGLRSNVKKNRDLDEFKTWAREMVTWYWSTDSHSFLWQVSNLFFFSHGCPISKMYTVNPLARRQRRSLRAHAPAIYAANDVDHKKRVAWFSFSMHACGSVPIVMVVRFGPPELCYQPQWQDCHHHIGIGVSVVVIIFHYFFHVGYFKHGTLYLFSA